MKAIILAAGRGVRLMPLTLKKPKPMVLVNDKPILHHIFEVLPKEIDEVILVVGYKQEKIRVYFKDNFLGKKISYVEGQKPLGTAYALSKAKEYIKEGEKFLFTFADDFHSKKAIHELVSSGNLGVLVQSHEDPSRFGVFEIDEKNRIISFVEKPKNPLSSLVSTGVFVLDSRIFSYESPMGPRGEYDLTDQVSALIKDVDFFAYHTDFWHPISSSADIKNAEEILQSKV